MLDFTKYLEESWFGSKGKNLHITHLEDLVFDGVTNARNAISFLQSLRDMLAGHTSAPHLNLSSKYDGAPSLFAGINPENGKFFVGTKGVFNKNAKLNYTSSDIDQNHPGSGLNSKLKIALRYLPELGIRGVVQGDMMFTNSDLKMEKLDGESYITFQPNTIVYAIPANTTLAKQITNAKMGVVWHTEYYGSKLENMTATYNVSIGQFKPSRNVWFRDARLVDLAGTITFTIDQTKQVTDILSRAGVLFQQISSRTFNEINENQTYKTLIMTYNNSKVREGEKITNTGLHVSGMIKWIDSKYNESILAAKKEDTKKKRTTEKNTVIRFFKSNSIQLRMIFDLQNLIVEAKTLILNKLDQTKQAAGTFTRDENGLKVTKPEGFVVSDMINGNVVKLVDRLSFSHQNFNTTKDWAA
jgi:hypothetical protein